MLDKVNATDYKFSLVWAVVGLEPTLPHYIIWSNTINSNNVEPFKT